ncbi:MAG: hypothetical protein CXR31_08110 [Geobacter sp.]|nr:MAG: hypothetical protein CXR31_08110 [Geobacter sp.]
MVLNSTSTGAEFKKLQENGREMVSTVECLMDTENLEEFVLDDDDLMVELSEEESPEDEFSWEDDSTADEGVQDTVTSLNTGNEPPRDPLSTATLAELYVSQGFLRRALTIYRELIETEPDNEELKARMFEIKEAIDRDQQSARDHALEGLPSYDASVPAASNASGAPVETCGTGDVLRTLEHWLENIGRRR